MHFPCSVIAQHAINRSERIRRIGAILPILNAEPLASV